MRLPPSPLNGACSAWALPPDARCASVARSLLSEVLPALGMGEEQSYDVAVAASELATNGWRHGIGAACPPQLELWAYRRMSPAHQLVVKVFDPTPGWRQGVWTEHRHEHGRGIEVVAALSAEWGWHPSRSRLAARPIPGKATWFCVPLDRPHAPAVRTIPEVARELHAELAGRGLGRPRCSHGIDRSLVSLPELTVWCEPPGVFRWRDPERPDAYERRPFADLVDVAEEAVRIHERR